jgi:hypothetical protein
MNFPIIWVAIGDGSIKNHSGIGIDDISRFKKILSTRFTGIILLK